MLKSSAPKTPSRRRVFLRIAFLVCLIVAASIASLPSFLSTDWGRRTVLRMASERSGYDLQARKWRITWFQPPEIDGLLVLDSSGRELVRAEKVRTSRAPLALLTANDLGLVRVQSGRLTIPAPSRPNTPGVLPPTQRPERTKPAPSAATPAVAAERSDGLDWPRRRLRLEVSDSSVAVRGLDGNVTNLFSRLQLTGDLNATNTMARWDGSAQLPLTGGEVRMDGSLALPDGSAQRLSELQLDARLSLDRLPAGPTLAVMSAFFPVPEGEGVWNAELSTQGSLARGIRWQGRMDGREVVFTRGVLGDDRLQLGELTLDTRGETDATGVRSADFHLTNVLARVDLNVVMPGPAKQGARLHSRINLAAFARQMPRLFDFKPGVAIENGDLDLTADWQSERGSATNLTAIARLENFSGSFEGNILSFDKPFLLDAQVSRMAASWKVGKLLANTPLGTISAEGDAGDFQAVLRTTLQDAFREAGKFIDTGSWEPSGDFQLVARQTSTASGRHFTLDGRSPSFTLLRGGVALAPAAPLALVFETDLSDKPVPDRASLTVQVPFLKGTVAATGFAPGGNIDQVQVAGKLQLAGLTRSLFHAGVLDSPGAFAEGELEVRQLRFSQQDGITSIQEFDGKVSGLASADASSPLPINEFELRGEARAEWATRSFGSTNLVIVAGGVEAKLDRLTSADWALLPGNLDVHGTLSARLESLPPMLREAAGFPADLKIAGKVDVEAGCRDRLAAASLVVQDFEYQRGSGLAYRDPQMRLDAWVNLPAPGEEVITIRNVRLISGVATAGGRGDLGPGGIDLTGELAYDLSRLSKLLHDLGVEDISLSGRESSAWKLRVPPKGGGDPAFEVRLAADVAEGYGLRFEKIQLPLSLSNQVLRLELQSAFEGGTVRVAPFLRLDEKQLSLRLDSSRPLLSNVALTPALADRLLARIHPVFKGSSVLEGRVDLQLSDFVMPLAPDWRARTTFGGMIRLRGARVASHGLLQEALQAAKIREQQLEIGDRDLTFAARDGRVTPQPLSVKIEGIPVVFSGSVGLDTTLRYQAALVVTETLARNWGLGSDVIPYLMGQELVIPVGGTVSKPDLDENAFKSRLGGLAKNAAEKALKEKAEDALRDLFDKKKKDK